ncbi:caspase family protein [Streptomyces sp. NBC_00847]|uniref:caspase family protein n=1 Tax=unclassified Streptomyces TaxID=2593676 RepID=UPI00225B515B|nr:caspase family protein [Streptomyces sp. NBC_00847]MCX4878141.1 caspase family protein [Streptomyces sp. NBC_00847]
MNDWAPASRAVLVGASAFTTLDDLPAVRANVPALKDLLGDPVLHLAAEHCQTLVDPASSREVSAAVRSAAQEATDTLLIYYAGHGLIDPGTGQLHLAVPDSDRYSVFDTAVPYEWIKRSVATSGATRRIVILDCCYSARAFGVQSESVAALAEIDGTYLMAAAAETAVALSPPGEPYTAFTGELLDLLQGGVASPSQFLDLDAVFDQLTRRLQAKGRPRPQSLCRNSLGSWPFARNNAYQPPPEGHITAPDVARALDATRAGAGAGAGRADRRAERAPPGHRDRDGPHRPATPPGRRPREPVHRPLPGRLPAPRRGRPARPGSRTHRPGKG